MIRARLRVVSVWLLIVLFVLLLVGTTYQGVATALERRRYPHPGQLVDVGGHQLHIFCRGDGTPTVVLEAPAGSMSSIWAWVQPEVARSTRVCSYDRAGLGWSEAGDRPYDPGRVPEELHALLSAANQPAPYLLVGHSLGAAFVRRFAGLYPGETTGLILIDGPAGHSHGPEFMALSPWLARVGILRATRLFSKQWKGLPPRDAGAVSAFLHRPDHLTRTSREIARWGDAVRLGESVPVPAHVRVDEAAGALNDERTARLVTAAVLTAVKRASTPRANAEASR